MNLNYNPYVAGAPRDSLPVWAQHEAGAPNTASGPAAAGSGPESIREINAVVADFSSYVRVPSNVLIIGNVKQNGTNLFNVPIAYSYHSGYGTNTTRTNVSGNYAVTLKGDYSGTFTPVKSGGTFSPSHRHYSNVIIDLLGQDYVFVATSGTVAPSTWLISGVITENGTGLGGMAVVFPGAGTAATSGAGTYAISVPNAYSGTATPLGIGGTFTPPVRVYVSVAANALNQDYVFATTPPAKLLISGTVAENGTGFSTALLRTGSALTYWSASNGSYGMEVDSGYSGTIRPVHIVAGTFVPENRVYTDVLAPYTNQDFAYSGTV